MTGSAYTSILINSLRHLWRKRSFWILQGLLAIGPVVISTIIFLVEPNYPITLGVSVPGIGTLALNFLTLPFLVARVILDDFGKVGEILWSGPMDSLVYFAGRFSGLWLGLAAGSLLQICGWFLASLLWLNIVTEWVWLLSLAIYLLSNFLGLAVIFLLAVLIRRNLPLTLTWAAAWVWIYYTVIFSEGLSEEFYPMHTTAFLNIFFHNLKLSPSMGLGLAQSRFLGMFAWFFGVGLVALSLTFLLSPLLDTRQSTRWRWFSPVLTAVALAAAFTGYSLNRHGIDVFAVQPSPQSVQIDDWEVLSQHTVLTVDADSGTVSGTARFEFSPTEDAILKEPQIVLRLNAWLALTAVSSEDGSLLDAERVGDSVVITLPAIPEDAFTLNLAWEGHLHIPYTAFEQIWKWYDAPDNYGLKYAPQPLKAFIQPDGGYLLRDGDWMPWPWTTQPHQARKNYLEIRPTGGDAVASVPITDGVALWTGYIPEALMVFLPGERIKMNEMTLALSPLLGNQHKQQAILFANAARAAATLFEIPPPRYAIVLPYLSRLIWSGDLLLIPDGGGDYMSLELMWLYANDVTGQKREEISRAALTSVARVYILDRLAPPVMEYAALLQPPGQDLELVLAQTLPADRWTAGSGRWVQAPEYMDSWVYWTPRWSLKLRPEGEWTSIALWIAIELADETTRQKDLDVIRSLDGQTVSGEGRSDRFEMVRQRIMPELVHTEKSQDIILKLHGIAEAIGTQEALNLLVTVMRETQPMIVRDLLAEMQQRSENLNSEVQP